MGRFLDPFFFFGLAHIFGPRADTFVSSLRGHKIGRAWIFFGPWGPKLLLGAILDPAEQKLPPRGQKFAVRAQN